VEVDKGLTVYKAVKKNPPPENLFTLLVMYGDYPNVEDEFDHALKEIRATAKLGSGRRGAGRHHNCSGRMKLELVAIAAIASIGFALPAHAADADAKDAAAADFAASKGAAAEAQLRQRLRERVRTIPGTDTQFFVGGYLQLDGIATRKKQDGDEQDTFLVSTIPFGPADADYRLSIRQSTFDWVSRTPTKIGHFWTRLEANLFPVDGTTALTLNQLLARWENHVVIGKTYSTFMDDGALPTTLDYNGPSGVTFVRQWLARGRIDLGAGWALEGSVEEPQADFAVASSVLAVTTSAERPDLAARLRYETDAGHLQVAGLWRRITVNATSPLGAVDRGVHGSGVSVSGSLALFEDDTLLFQAVTGEGVGRYFNDPISSTGVALEPGGRLALVRQSGATLYYQRKWAPAWMSVAGASALWISTDALRSADALRRISYASANLIHLLTPELLVGAELLWGRATRVDGADATNLRLQLSLRYLIF
jgi:hypothetical protein